MVIYNCEFCNYSTKYTTNFNKHCQSIKHLRNKQKSENGSLMVLNTQCQHNVNTKSTQCQHRKTTENL